MKHQPLRSTRGRGFTLLEILVAFTLLALIVSVLMRVFSGGLQGLGLAEDYAQAASIAESRIATVGHEIALKPGEATGETGGRYRWRVVITPYEQPNSDDTSQLGRAQAIERVELFNVRAAVDWSEYGQDRSFSLTTLRLAAKSP